MNWDSKLTRNAYDYSLSAKILYSNFVWPYVLTFHIFVKTSDEFCFYFVFLIKATYVVVFLRKLLQSLLFLYYQIHLMILLNEKNGRRICDSHFFINLDYSSKQDSLVSLLNNAY